ncbi:MAG: hypothetical protein JSR87_14190 [Proteobacteria bacterium]|nr:hypothetical protein [Pseudomonadota bacterium]MBS0571816.1 hypothetical protein [Pseudomonadota bacterium]
MARLLFAAALLAGAWLYTTGGGRFPHASGGGSLMGQFGAPAGSVGGTAVGVAARIGN